MRGTGSHEWTVSDVFVPEHRTVQRRRPVADQPVAALAGHALRAARARAGRAPPQRRRHRHRARRHRHADRARRRQGPARARLGCCARTPRSRRPSRAPKRCSAPRRHSAPPRSATSGRPSPPVRKRTLQQRARCRLAASFAVDSARQAMDLMYRAGGTTSSKRTHQLARCWRDLHVVGQAASVAADWYALAGEPFWVWIPDRGSCDGWPSSNCSGSGTPCPANACCSRTLTSRSPQASASR